MNNNPKISVIVPVYNAENYLDRCMRSIYDQTFKDYEIILVNDGSTDKSAEICKRYQVQDNRVTYIEKQNEYYRDILIASSGNLTLNATGGNIGSVESAINVKVLGSIDTLSADNVYVNLSGSGLVGKLRADNANINTSEIRLAINEGIINSYAEFRNNDKLAVVDNLNSRRIEGADIQLYTAKAGPFFLTLDDTINIKTNAPVVYNNPHMLANGYHSEGNFVNKGQKESKVMFESVKTLEAPDMSAGGEALKIAALRFDTSNNKALTADYTVYEISASGVTVKNDKDLRVGDITTITFDISDVTVSAKVVDVEDGKARLEFIDMTEEDEEKIHSMFNSLIQ